MTPVKDLFCFLTSSALVEVNVQHLLSPLIKERMQDVKKLVVGTVLTEKCQSLATEELGLSFSTAMVLAT